MRMILLLHTFTSEFRIHIFPFFILDKSTDSAPETVDEEEADAAKDDSNPKTEEQNPMDFAANIEKVKEVRKILVINIMHCKR